MIEAQDAHVIYWSAVTGRIAGLTLRQLGPSKSGKGLGAVDFNGGSALLEDSDLTSADGAII
ncbi:MAG: hypothetical protein KTR21_01210, partial [Rhodobacteraceae bacterium]|nr:hypothetical protein [Paracoccaceae bacterium]